MTDANDDKIKLQQTIRLLDKPLKFADKPIKLIEPIKIRLEPQTDDFLKNYLQNVRRR